MEHSFYQTCFGHGAAQTQTLGSNANSICAALSLPLLRMGRKSVIPGAAEDSVLCSTPKRVTVSAQAWLVWMLTS